MLHILHMDYDFIFDVVRNAYLKAIEILLYLDYTIFE